MLRSDKLKNHVQYHISLIVALVVLIGAAILMPGPAAFTAPLLGPIWSVPVSPGPAITSAFSDQGPAISPDGLSLYFTSNRTGGVGGFDMYVSHRASVGDAWGSPVNFGPALNTTFDEGNPAFSRDGQFVFFQSKRLPTFGGIDIWVSHRNNPHDDFDWQPAVNLGPGVNSTSDDNGPTYFEDDVRGTRQLFFGSSRLGGPGAADIYVSEQMVDDSFGPAVLVTELSSPLNENRPSIRNDGLEIFFQSNRVGSGGPSDLWVATRGSTVDAWSTPVNLGSTINTTFMEQNAYLSSDGMTLFFTSDRPTLTAGLNLYMTTRTLPIVRSKNISVAANDSCAAGISPSDVDDGSFDSVSGGTLTLSLDPAGQFGLGPHTIRLIGTDDRGVTNSAIAIVTVVDQTPPTITAPPAVAISTGPGASSCGAFVSDAALGTATASDNCSLPTTTRSGIPPANFFPVGTTIINYSAVDGAGNTASATQNVTVVDNTPPLITGASVDKPTLRPPNHRLVLVTVSYSATDNCGPVRTALSVSSNEPVNGKEDRGEDGRKDRREDRREDCHRAPDWVVLDAHHVLLRAERSGHGNGRIYTITITATDSNGNASTQLVTVRVPHH